MHLASKQIHLYLASPQDICDDALWQRYETLLTADERTQMSRLYHAGHRKQYLLTRALLRSSLSACHPLDPRDWRFELNGYGKPSVDPRLPARDIRFNLSHSNGLIVCAITREIDIGVDVEDAQRTTRAAPGELSRYFSTRETEALAALPADRQKQRFFDYWTLKEAYIKARGMGLAIPLAKFSFVFKADRLTGLELHPDLQDDAGHWRFWRVDIGGRYRIAVALNSAGRGFRLNAFNAVPLLRNDPVTLNFL